jgi:caffeoyl-CoA O-methyltransferase
LEIGVFTGYSALAIALAMPPEGKVVACDVSEEYTSIARRYWKEAGVEKKIDLHLAPALDTLEQLANGGDIGPFDMAFIDADKANVDNYYERSLKLLRRNGVILVDNVLWGGSVADPGENDADTSALRAISKKAAQDERVEACLLSIGDGLLLARKK